MKVLFVTNPYMSNPFTRTLVEGLNRLSKDDKFVIDIDSFWNDSVYDYDVIHVMFPHELLYGPTKNLIKNIKERLDRIEERGIKLVSTCHNFAPHLSNEEGEKIYDLVYNRSHMIFHLGEYSKKIFEERFSLAQNVLLPHHVYDTLYNQVQDPLNARTRNGFKKNDKILLCFGAIRNDAERNMLVELSGQLKKFHIKLWVPSFYRVYNRRNLCEALKYLFYKLKYSNIKMQMGYTSDAELPSYFAASDVSFIPRMKILNSGNVPLAMFFGKVIVGPNVGNVGLLLSSTGNFCFNVSDRSSILPCVLDAFSSSSKGKGEENRKYAIRNFATTKIAQRLLDYYYGL